MMDPTSAEAPDALETLVVDCLAAVEDSGLGAIETFCRAHPRHAAALRRRLELLAESGLLDEPPADQKLPERVGDYRVVERLGGGGMGEVYRAVQEGLDREVALKTIRPELLHFGDARERFRREVETLARLSHPGIVPVYGSGESDGMPWFAMEHIAGASLSAVLAAVEGRDPARLTGSDLRRALSRACGRSVDGDTWPYAGTWLEACLCIGREVAGALDHAHRTGVLHRDVKPSNVLLGVDGRARLFDFGLARMDGPEVVNELTRTGAMVGSLPYMAPEQIRGGQVDRRTDVYGLAATLAELLTLRLLHEQTRADALRDEILSGRRPRLATRNRAIPRDLEVVFEKALEPDMGRRYATAGEFARDLDAVLQLRPVSARPAGPWLRLDRWARRRPGAAVAAAFGLLALIVVPIVLLFVNAEIRRALGAARVAKQDAEARFDDAYDAIVGLVAVVGDEDLRDVPGAGPIRLDVLQRSLSLFERLLAERPDDSALHVEHARIERQIASVLDDLGRGEEAEQARVRAEERFRARAEDPLVAFELVDLLVDRTAIAPADTLVTLAEAEQLLAVAEAADAETLSPARLLAARRQLLHNRAVTLRRDGDFERALEVVDRALEVSERLLTEASSDDPAARLAAGASHSLRAIVLLDLERGDEAVREFEQADRILRALVADDPRPAHRHRLALSLTNSAVRAYRAGSYLDAESDAAEARALAEQLVHEQPYRISYRRQLASATEAFALALAGQKRFDEAATRFVQNAQALDALWELSPDTRLAFHRAIAHHNCAAVLIDVERRSDAIAHAELAASELDRLANETGNRASRRHYAAAMPLVARARLAVGELPDRVELERLVVDRTGGHQGAWFTLAECFADAAGFLQSRDRGEDAERMALAAVDAFASAIDAGFARPDEVDAQARFDSVRRRDDFQAQRARLDG